MVSPPATESHPHRATRRSNKASAWAGVAIDVIVAGIGFVFTVLLGGLVGGYLGQAVGLGLYLVKPDWVPYGSQGGWVVGALLTVIGLPGGWVTVNGRTWSMPSPRRLRQRAARHTHRRRRRSDWPPCRRLIDILKSGGILGLMGVVAGFMLGATLLISWFSLALSPFSPERWMESIQWGGGAMATADKLPLYLFFGPPVLAGVLGLIFGTVVGAIVFVGHLRRGLEERPSSDRNGDVGRS